MPATGSPFPATGMPDSDWWRALWPDPEVALRALGVEPGMSALDLCCGDGWFTVPMARLTGGRVYALDLDPEMLRQAHDAADRAGIHIAGWIEADARQLETLLPCKVDFVLIANTFHGVQDQPGMAGTVAKVLMPGGRFAIVNWHARPREETIVLGAPRGPSTELRMTPERTRSVVEPTGFVLDRLVDLPPFHYGAVFRLQG